jgi:hypothetical protein
MRTRRLVTGMLLAIVSIFSIAGPAAATGPTRVFREGTRVIAASPETCPFDIVSHFEGTFLFFEYPDGSTKVTVASVFVTWSNPISDASLTTPLAGPVIVSAPNPDGTVTVTIPGNDGGFIATGEGIIFGSIGHLVYLADADDPTLTPIEILAADGIQDPSPFPAVCDPLS